MMTGRPEDVLGWLKPGQRVYFQGGPGECSVFRELLVAHPERAAGVRNLRQRLTPEEVIGAAAAAVGLVAPETSVRAGDVPILFR